MDRCAHLLKRSPTITVANPQAEPRPRYEEDWGREFWAFVDRNLVEGCSVLDIGGGRTPTIDPLRRPPGTWYAGLDVSTDELDGAPAGSYDEKIVADVQRAQPSLRARFDLIVSWQALEHVSDMVATSRVLREYLRPGGELVACLSGRNAAFALANRALPDALASRLVAWVMHRPREGVFHAHYDRCDASGLRFAFGEFADVEVVARWRGASYFDRWPHLKRAYLRYEDWALRQGHENLATHYVLAARKATAE